MPLIALLTSPGAVLIHNGQEYGEDYRLPVSGAGRVQPRPLIWEFLDDTAGQPLLALHQKLIQIRKAHPALRSHNFYPRHYDERMTGFNDQGYGVDVSRSIVIYHRWGTAGDGLLERFIVVLNFSDYDQHLNVPFSTNGIWQDLLNDGEYLAQDYQLPNHLINSNWGKVFYHK